jgi:uncharacterized protein with NRDE domain
LCLIALAWRARPDLPLLVAANRDEWRERPTQPAHWWPDHPGIFAGRDLQAGGTWMGITRAGRFAAVTNFRDPSDKRASAKSRGALVSGFLLSTESPEAFLRGLAASARDYNGFTLLASDGLSLWSFASREGVPREVPAGVHALSNHLLDEPWPKVTQAREAMTLAVAERDPEPSLEAFLSRSTPVADEHLPVTGVGLAWERRLSPPLIVGEDYGTRSSTLLRVDAHGAQHFREITRGADGRVVSTTTNHNDRRIP